MGAAFVLVWSSGYIAGPVAVASSAPFTALAARFVIAAVVAGLWAWRRDGLPTTWRGAGRHAAVGLVLNGVQFGLMYVAFEAGLQPTLGALLHSLSPVLTVLLAGLLLRERVRPVQVLGFALGVVGVVVVLGPEVDQAGGVVGLVAAGLATLGLSLGWLGQRWLSADLPASWSAALQLGVSVPFLAVLALALEGPHVIEDGRAFVGSLLWLSLVNSVAGLWLIQALVRRGGAGASSSVFFLMPPVTAVLAFLWFGDTLDARELVGLVVAVVGVAAASRAGDDQRDRSPESRPAV